MWSPYKEVNLVPFRLCPSSLSSPLSPFLAHRMTQQEFWSPRFDLLSLQNHMLIKNYPSLWDFVIATQRRFSESQEFNKSLLITFP